MTPFRSVDRWLAGFATMCVLTLLAEMFWPHPLSRPIPSVDTGATPTDTADGAQQVGPRPEYQLVADRPLFTPDRRPFVSRPDTPTDAAPPRIQVTLTAIVTTADARVALLTTDASSEVFKVRVNETVQGWTLIEIRSDAVVLQQGEDTTVVALQPERLTRTGLPISDALARDP